MRFSSKYMCFLFFGLTGLKRFMRLAPLVVFWVIYAYPCVKTSIFVYMKCRKCCLVILVLKHTVQEHFKADGEHTFLIPGLKTCTPSNACFTSAASWSLCGNMSYYSIMNIQQKKVAEPKPVEAEAALKWLGDIVHDEGTQRGVDYWWFESNHSKPD